MYALTIWQPWASLIVSGPKRIENRGWRPWTRVLGKRIAIHAAKRRMTRDERAFAISHRITTASVGGSLPTGAVLGTAIIAAVLARRYQLAPEDADQAEWWNDDVPWHWLLADVRMLATPIPCKGAQGLWPIPDEIARAVAS